MVRQGTNQEREEERENRYKEKSQLHFLWASRKTSADSKPHEVTEGREALGFPRQKEKMLRRKAGGPGATRKTPDRLLSHL